MQEPQTNPDMALKVSEQKFPITHYFDTLPTTNCGEQTLALYRGLPKLHRMKSLVVTGLGRFKAPVAVLSHAITTVPFPNPAFW